MNPCRGFSFMTDLRSKKNEESHRTGQLTHTRSIRRCLRTSSKCILYRNRRLNAPHRPQRMIDSSNRPDPPRRGRSNLDHERKDRPASWKASDCVPSRTKKTRIGTSRPDAGIEEPWNRLAIAPTILRRQTPNCLNRYEFQSDKFSQERSNSHLNGGPSAFRPDWSGNPLFNNLLCANPAGGRRPHSLILGHDGNAGPVTLDTSDAFLAAPLDSIWPRPPMASSGPSRQSACRPSRTASSGLPSSCRFAPSAPRSPAGLRWSNCRRSRSPRRAVRASPGKGPSVSHGGVEQCALIIPLGGGDYQEGRRRTTSRNGKGGQASGANRPVTGGKPSAE